MSDEYKSELDKTLALCGENIRKCGQLIKEAIVQICSLYSMLDKHDEAPSNNWLKMHGTPMRRRKWLK